VPRHYPAEFQRKVLDLPAADRPVAQVAHDLQISVQATYTWRQQLIDSGHMPGTTSRDHAELIAARKRIAKAGERTGDPLAGHGAASAVWYPKKAVRGDRGTGH
jgi:transposase